MGALSPRKEFIMANNTFIKVGKLIINTTAIAAIFPNDRRGYTLLINGHEFYVTEDEGRSIVDHILDNDTTTSFDPDKRIVPTANAADDETRFMKAAALIRSAVTEHNREYSPSSEVSIEVNKDKRSIDITRGHYSAIRIVDGLVIEDSIANVETYAEMKRKINDILIGTWIK